MYVVANLIYGVPLTKKLCENLPVDYDELENHGFTLLYSENSDHQMGFLGVNLGTFDESLDVIGIHGESVVIEDGEGKIEFCPTSKNKKEVKQMLADLPKDLKETVKSYGRPVGMYIIWGTN